MKAIYKVIQPEPVNASWKIRLDNACDRRKVAGQEEMHCVTSGTFLLHGIPNSHVLITYSKGQSKRKVL